MTSGQDPATWDCICDTSEPKRTLMDIVREYLAAVEAVDVLAQFRLRKEMRERVDAKANSPMP